MRHFSFVILSFLLLGSFVTPATACMDGDWQMYDRSAASVAQTRTANTPRVSARTLKNQQRAMWKKTAPAVKGF